MKLRLLILILALATCLPAVGCRMWTTKSVDEPPHPEVEAVTPKAKRHVPVDERPTGTSDRAREIERSLGLGR